jgi:3-oxoadipate enol-lactonase
MPDICLGSMKMEDQGEGPSIVMIHGLGGTSNSFQTLISATARYRVLRPDLPGAGRSLIRPGLPGLKGLAVAVKDCLKAAGIKRAHFVGHSMGTLICQYLAVEDPEMVSSMVLYGPILEPAIAARQSLRERAQIARMEGMAGIADTVATASVSKQKPVAAAFVRESLLRQDPAGYAAHCEALAEAKAVDHSFIQCPTLLIAGQSDLVAPVAVAQQLNQQIHGSRLEVISAVAHWMMVEAPARSARLLGDHLDASRPE